MQKQGFIVIWLIWAVGVVAQPKPLKITGRVFLDKNGNGLTDAGEPGLKRVPVSNGDEVVYTDAQGRYELSCLEGMSVFPVLPDGYTVPRKNGMVNNASFFYIGHAMDEAGKVGADFALQKEKQESRFAIGAIGDIQVGDSLELGYAMRSVFSELTGRSDLAFHLHLGDLVNDDLSLLHPMRELMDQMPVPAWTVPGNHDRNTSVQERMDGTFNECFGAASYAFNYGGVHFVALNNVYATGKRSYEGRVGDRQLRFLKNDLAGVPKGRLVVLVQHIPLNFTKNKADVLALLQPFDHVLVLSGHTHQISRHFFAGGKVQELVAGAACGTWWTGTPDANGVPDALMQCGSPRNYFVIEFQRDGQYRIRFKGIGLDERRQLDVKLGDSLLVNVYAGSDSTRVWAQIDGREWRSLKQVRITAPEVTDELQRGKGSVKLDTPFRPIPLRRRPSPHMWALPMGGLTKGAHQIRIKAFDRFGLDVTGELVSGVPSQ